MKKGDLLPLSGLILHRLEPRKITKNPRPLEILFEDDALLYINKPAGLPSVPKNNDDLHGDSVAARLYDRFEWARAQALHDSGLCHRLDNDTSGILLAAKGPQKQKTLKQQWHEIDKGYLALMQGQLNQNTLETSAIMHHPKAKHKMITQSVSDASRTSKRDAATLFCPFQVSDHITLAGTFLKSPGHRHQIRVHALALGMPLCGDKVYGGPDNKSMLTRSSRHHAYPAWKTHCLCPVAVRLCR